MGMPSPRGVRGGSVYQPLAEINVTPMVDVMLVLLIIFMVTAPLMATGLKVDLPQARAAQSLNPKEPLVVTVGRDGKLTLGADEVAADALVDAVRAKMAGDSSRIVHIRGDKDAGFGAVVAIMDQLSMHGVTHIAIVTSPRSSEASK